MLRDNEIGITERGDAALDLSWVNWVMQNKPAILISKDPLKLCSILEGLKHSNIIVHATITGYGHSDLEPNVPVVDNAFEGYSRLINKLGNARVVLRVDPVIPSEEGISI